MSVEIRILEDKDELLRQLADLGQVPFVLTSSKRGKGLSDMLDVCMATHDTWRKKLRWGLYSTCRGIAKPRGMESACSSVWDDNDPSLF
jgi:hypothetical protein